MAQPLEGIRVLDLGQIYQGPYAGFLLAKAGAEVIKVEPPMGERLRGPGGANTPMAFALLNSNKKSITLDLKHDRGRELFKALVVESDVVLENFAPGVMDRLGLGHATLSALNPRLVYATGTGYGISGPERDQLAMDHTIQAVSGLMSVTGEPDGPPTRAGGAMIDILGGTHLYAAIVTALMGRERSGEGTLAETAMLESMYFALCTNWSDFHRTGEVPSRTGNRTPSVVTPYGNYECSDGRIAIICVSNDHWLRVTEVIGREELKDDPRFANARLRFEHEALINEMISQWCAARTRDEAYALMRAKTIPVAPVRTLDEVRDDPHMHARGMLEYREHPEMGPIVLANSPLRFPELGLNEIRFHPSLGEHNEEIYQGLLGLDDDTLASFKDEGVI
jgi:CoA:oxalate CoA-transferase